MMTRRQLLKSVAIGTAATATMAAKFKCGGPGRSNLPKKSQYQWLHGDLPYDHHYIISDVQPGFGYVQIGWAPKEEPGGGWTKVWGKTR